jgi:predicted nuclease of restriction endonuclease-like (RecB) superfamily
MTFEELVKDIQNTSNHLQKNTVKAINIHITLRNWITGFFIVEFEQNGKERANYGGKLLENLSDKINIKGLTAPELSRCRQFYSVYPEILGLLTQEFNSLIPINVINKLDTLNNYDILGSSTQELKKSNISDNKEYFLNLITSFSYTHFVELIKINDSLKRKFYELLILKTTPSVKELKRQIATLSFERLGLSKDTEVAFQQIENKILPESFSDVLKSHYFFDFLNISNSSLIEETELEQALIQHLQNFIIELGNGFCFEARQKRILIGDEYYFIDLIFYHRILKCHVLVELKTDNIKHEHIGQLKTYINYYKKHFVEKTDNPPIGILLVTERNKALVEYAIADSDKDIFVSKYLLQLPKKEDIEEFINRELKNN